MPKFLSQEIPVSKQVQSTPYALRRAPRPKRGSSQTMPRVTAAARRGEWEAWWFRHLAAGAKGKRPDRAGCQLGHRRHQTYALSRTRPTSWHLSGDTSRARCLRGPRALLAGALGVAGAGARNQGFPAEGGGVGGMVASECILNINTPAHTSQLGKRPSAPGNLVADLSSGSWGRVLVGGKWWHMGFGGCTTHLAYWGGAWNVRRGHPR